ncbi:MAG TPA: hypothetical protein PLF61_06775, partial [Candidatus Goldiibacteriota bacterium]|nr:hypothetical protein [Candidatus Goldiibacteriota bacterium]
MAVLEVQKNCKNTPIKYRNFILFEVFDEHCILLNTGGYYDKRQGLEIRRRRGYRCNNSCSL